ncbi:hypothetical protein EM6_2648 [Asticcacaulis excentricus]|uniref:Uncharacterized protein n=1 Tax=Asticcacaulis excentricus TaxID=78587 RepID=A0A3G9GBT1_9CAUL|nr:hypothetical protein EM6_2648 [Asticcacaulis excentricus]
MKEIVPLSDSTIYEMERKGISAGAKTYHGSGGIVSLRVV